MRIFSIPSGKNTFFSLEFTRDVLNYSIICYPFKNIRGFTTVYVGADHNEIKRNSNLCAYLAGLVEGDGSIAVHEPNSKSQKYRPKFIIVFKRADLPLANYLSQLTGCGKVYDKPERGYVL